MQPHVGSPSFLLSPRLPDAIIGTLGAGDVDDDEEDDSAEGGYTTKR